MYLQGCSLAHQLFLINKPSIGIEQTSHGIHGSRFFSYPTIEVASAAAKQLEAPMLAQVVQQQLNIFFSDYLPSLGIAAFLDPNIFNKITIGIVGIGNIGKAILKNLQELGHKDIIIYDKEIIDIDNKKGVTIAKDIEELIEGSCLIIGCTGKDFMAGHFRECLPALTKSSYMHVPKLLVSVSSKDVEFNSLLVHIQQNNRNGPINPLGDILYPKKDPKVIILGGGTPLNFFPVHTGRSTHSIPPEDIQLTRGLLAIAFLQAVQMMNHDYNQIIQFPEQYKLDPVLQRLVVQLWCQAKKQNMIEKFKDLDYIEEYSGTGKTWVPPSTHTWIPSNDKPKELSIPSESTAKLEGMSQNNLLWMHKQHCESIDKTPLTTTKEKDTWGNQIRKTIYNYLINRFR